MRLATMLAVAGTLVACSAPSTTPTSPTPVSVIGTVSQEPPPVPPRLDTLPPPRALGGTRFVAFGDSITYGTLSGFDGAFLYDDPARSYPVRVQLALQQTFPAQAAQILIVNAGSPGERALDARRRLQTVLQTYNPQGVLLLEGINDMTFGASHAEAAAAVVELVHIARLHNVTVLLGLMPQTYASVYPSGETRTQAAERIVPFNNELRRLVAGMQNVHVVDLYSRFGNNRALMGNDGLHPSEAGYEVMASTFAQAIEVVFPVRGSLQ